MKTLIHILTAIFLMNFSFLSAGNPRLFIIKVYPKVEKISLHPADLAPKTPGEALFSDNDIEPRPLNEISRLTPITPKEATFEEVDDESITPLILQKIAPETPKEAEFEESTPENRTEIHALAPIAPVSAPFEE